MKKLLFNALVAIGGFCSLLVASSSADVTVTVGGDIYTVTTESLANGPSSLGVLEAQPEWGNENLANALAAAVGPDGVPNGAFGPFFAFGLFEDEDTIHFLFYNPSVELVGAGNADVGSATYAIVSNVSPVPDQTLTIRLVAFVSIVLCVQRRYLAPRLAAA